MSEEDHVLEETPLVVAQDDVDDVPVQNGSYKPTKAERGQRKLSEERAAARLAGIKADSDAKKKSKE